MTISIYLNLGFLRWGILSEILKALTRYSANDPQLPVNDVPLFTGAKPDDYSTRLNVRRTC